MSTGHFMLTWTTTSLLVISVLWLCIALVLFIKMTQKFKLGGACTLLAKKIELSCVRVCSRTHAPQARTRQHRFPPKGMEDQSCADH